MKRFAYGSLPSLRLPVEILAVAACVLLAPMATAQTAVLTPREARAFENGKIQDDGSFSFWDDGMLSDWFVAPAGGPVSIAIEARGVVAGGSPPLMAVELVSPQGAAQEIARLPIDAKEFQTFTVQATVPKGLFGLRLRHLNRTADAEKKLFRHLILRQITLTGAERSDMTPAQYLLWGSPGQPVSQPQAAEKIASFETKGLRVAIDSKNARWSISQKEENGARLDDIAPVFSIADLPVNLADCRGTFDTEADSSSPLGDSTKAILRYGKPGAYEIVCTLWVSRANDEALVQTDFHNLTGKALTVAWIASLASPKVTLGGQAADWMAISDARSNGEPYQSLRLGGPRNLSGWWYLAIKNEKTRKSLLLGNLSNNKGSGRFELMAAGDAAVKVAAYNDYERIVMPTDAWIRGEKVLLHFGRRGNDSLERFGDLTAIENKIDLRRDHPIDPYDPARVAIFTGWSSWGASVIEGFPYQHNKEKYKGPSLDPEWRKRNQQKVLDVGLDDYGYATKEGASIASAGTPLARNYGHPQDRPTYQIKLAPELQQLHPECYINNRVDFSNPVTQEYEKKRVEDGFAKADGLARYSWDFTNRWQKLDGQYDPFMTSAETYRLAMGLWRDAGRRHPGGAYGLVWMNVVGFNYDRVDVIHIGADSDHGYASGNLSVTRGLVRQISGRYFYNGKVWWNSPDS
ncbi:MAG: hypothetical protein NTW86_30950, partial [Candidatus Sumerlaeota bacterium]|nr:hypothetical protein [Candidatus Sumerlaeota bacterium]